MNTVVKIIEKTGHYGHSPKKDLPYVIDQFQKQAQKEITLAQDILVQRKGGSIFYAEVNSAPVIFSGKK